MENDTLSQILERVYDLNEDELQMVLSFINDIIHEDSDDGEINSDTSTDNEDEDENDEENEEEDEPIIDINSQEYKDVLSRLSKLPPPGSF